MVSTTRFAVVSLLGVLPSLLPQPALADYFPNMPTLAGHSGLLYKRNPLLVPIATLPPNFDVAKVSDIQSADLDQDGRKDLVVSWFATDAQSWIVNQRYVTILLSQNGELQAAHTVNLFVPDFAVPSLSVFRNGAGRTALGDFDGDGDIDIAAGVFFGDELWVLENLHPFGFFPHLKLPYLTNSNTNFQTPPALAAVDFDQDGKDELVYIADAIHQIGQQRLHFWKTDSNIAQMVRMDWDVTQGDFFNRFNRAMSVSDFDGDGRVDIIFSGATDFEFEADPVIAFWRSMQSGDFSATSIDLPMLVADLAVVQPNPDCPPGFVLVSNTGSQLQYWRNNCNGSFQLAQTVTGLAGTSSVVGAGLLAADVDGDRETDLIIKQRAGTQNNPNQIQFVRWNPDLQTFTVAPSLVSTNGLWTGPVDENLRPRNMAAVDLFGNTLPELVAGFAASPTGGALVLRLAIWENSCRGDINADGVVNVIDLGSMLQLYGLCDSSPIFDADADLNKDGCISAWDLGAILSDWGCKYDQ